MVWAFFAQAAHSPGRQRTFRGLVIAHLALLASACWLATSHREIGVQLLGHALLVAGMVEGALLLGWRLTQLPKSQALEFLFVSPLRPWRVFCGEAAVGIGRLAFVTLSGAPLLLFLVIEGRLLPFDVALLLLMPFTWGVVAGLALITWAYEPIAIRRWGERIMLLFIVLYLLVGVLAGERLREWLAWLFPGGSHGLWSAFESMHTNSPFAVLQSALQSAPEAVWGRLLVVQALALVVVVAMFVRAASRLKGHFDDRHYRPAFASAVRLRPRVGDKPLSWWAVKRVSEYSGRVNLWLAGGFALLYALYTLAGASWPPWLGRHVFAIFDRLGGVPMVATALVVLAAVPAAFQYGLWDSNAQDRCRRMELLMLTELDARDYWDASAAAAWRRGRGYFVLAGFLWAAHALAGPVSPLHIGFAAAAGVVLWSLYFTLGFHAFIRGAQANQLGLLLSVGMPLLAIAAHTIGGADFAVLVPPACVYSPGAGHTATTWLPAFLGSVVVTLTLARTARQRCEVELRRWYENHHGARGID